MRRAGDAVLRAVTRDVLDPEVVSEALNLALRELGQPDTAAAARVGSLKSEFARIEAELARYAEAIADAAPLEGRTNEFWADFSRDTAGTKTKLSRDDRDNRQAVRLLALSPPWSALAWSATAPLGGPSPIPSELENLAIRDTKTRLPAVVAKLLLRGVAGQVWTPRNVSNRKHR